MCVVKWFLYVLGITIVLFGYRMMHLAGTHSNLVVLDVYRAEAVMLLGFLLVLVAFLGIKVRC